MAIDPKSWTTGHVEGDQKFTTANQIRSRIEAIRRNRGLSDSQHNQYWVDRIRSGEATIGDARTALTEKARKAIAKRRPKKRPIDKKAKLKLTPAQMRQIMQGRRDAKSTYQNRVAELAAMRGRTELQGKTSLAELSREFGQTRKEGLTQLGGRGLASQPRFAGKMLRDLRNEEGAKAGAIEAQMGQARAARMQAKQAALADRDRVYADMKALEAAFRGSDIDRLLGDAGRY